MYGHVMWLALAMTSYFYDDTTTVCPTFGGGECESSQKHAQKHTADLGELNVGDRQTQCFIMHSPWFLEGFRPQREIPKQLPGPGPVPSNPRTKGVDVSESLRRLLSPSCTSHWGRPSQLDLHVALQ